MTDDEAADKIGAIMARALTEARETGLSEEQIAMGAFGVVLDIVKRSDRREAWARMLDEYRALLAPQEGEA